MRSAKYVAKRVLRLTGSPHAIAAGVAAGVFASFTPFLGLHFLIAFALAYIIAGNFIAAAMGTFFGNPLSFPFIWASTYSVGDFILSGGGRHGSELPGNGHLKVGEFSKVDIFELGFSGIWEKIIGLWEPVFKPMTIGAVPLGIAAGISAYVITRWLAIMFRTARKKRLDAKAARAAELTENEDADIQDIVDMPAKKEDKRTAPEKVETAAE
ncbi:MAG: DUF2062 domain-containing protein [Rhizobiaceae bacterium]